MDHAGGDRVGETTMTRRLLAFLAPSLLAAQCVTRKDGMITCPDAVRSNASANARRRRPKNGECPECGEVAEPYRIEIGPYSWQLDPSRRIDCEYCGNTFRQWAEGKEPRR